MNQKIGQVSLLVKEYDEAILFFTKKLDFQLISDVDMGNHTRWVIVAPKGSKETQIVLSKATSAKQVQHIGDQSGGGVFLFLHTDDFWRDFNLMKNKGVIFLEEPREEVYGTVVVLEDCYGNKWDLIEPQS